MARYGFYEKACLDNNLTYAILGSLNFDMINAKCPLEYRINGEVTT